MTSEKTTGYIEFGCKKKKLGKIEFELEDDVVPKTVNNFIQLIKHKYKGCVVHRIIPGFVIQTGDFTRGNGSGGFSVYGEHFEDENFNLKHEDIGILSMANAGPDTNGSQFFITLDYVPHLDNKHVVFGRIKKNDKNIKILKILESYGSLEGKTKELIKITACGLNNE